MWFLPPLLVAPLSRIRRNTSAASFSSVTDDMSKIKVSYSDGSLYGEKRLY